MRKFLTAAVLVLVVGAAVEAANFVPVAQTQVVRQRTVTRTAFAAPVVTAPVAVQRTFVAQRAFVPHASVQRTFFAAQSFAPSYGFAAQRTFFAAPTFAPAYGLASPALSAGYSYSYGAASALPLAAPAYAAPCAPQTAAPSADLGLLRQRVDNLEYAQREAALRAEFDAKLRTLQLPTAPPLAAPVPKQ